MNNERRWVMDKVLKACPFCGAPGHKYVDAGGYWLTECSKCDTAGPDGAEAWNRRPIEDALRVERDAAVARAEAAEAELKRWREPQGDLDLLIDTVALAIEQGEHWVGPSGLTGRSALDGLRDIVIGSATAKAEGRADEREQVVAFCNAVGHHGARDAIAAGLHWNRD